MADDYLVRDELSHDEHVRLEALSVLAVLYAGSSRATWQTVKAAVPQVVEYIETGTIT